VQYSQCPENQNRSYAVSSYTRGELKATPISRAVVLGAARPWYCAAGRVACGLLYTKPSTTTPHARGPGGTTRWSSASQPPVVFRPYPPWVVGAGSGRVPGPKFAAGTAAGAAGGFLGRREGHKSVGFCPLGGTHQSAWSLYIVLAIHRAEGARRAWNSHFKLLAQVAIASAPLAFGARAQAIAVVSDTSFLAYASAAVAPAAHRRVCVAATVPPVGHTAHHSHALVMKALELPVQPLRVSTQVPEPKGSMAAVVVRYRRCA
jgi:hypothetical protein